MQNREELRYKCNDRSQKTLCPREGEKKFSEGGGGGIKLVLEPKYRPLLQL
jgi:hypothetical protein